MASSILSHLLGIIYRPYTKWGTDFVCQGLLALLTSNFVRLEQKNIKAMMASLWSRDIVQFTDQIQNEDEILGLKIYMNYWLQTLLDMLEWQKIYINGSIILVTWHRWKLQTRHKMVIRFCISISMFILNSNFFRYVLVTRDLHQWCPHGGHRNWVQFKNQMQNKDQILLLKLYIRYWFQTLSDILG